MAMVPRHRAAPAGRRVLVGLVAAGVILTACGTAAPTRSTTASPTGTTSGPAFPVAITDDDGVSVTMQAPPARIVTFAPSNTEIVFALGLGDRLVGVSGSFDDYPPQAEAIEKVGGSGEFGVDPNVEKVVSLHPDLMLTISGGDQWKSRLRDLGIVVFTVNATDFDDLVHDIGTVGNLTGAEEAARTLTARMTAAEQQVQSAVGTEADVTCFFEAYYPPLTTVGPHTFIADLLDRAGCASVSAGASSDYPEWSVDQLVRESPDVYLVASESGVSADAVAKRPGFGGIAAVKAGNVHLIDSDLISRPGPRVVEGLRALAALLHPGASG